MGLFLFWYNKYMKSIQSGNAELDSATTRGWLLGDFIDE